VELVAVAAAFGVTLIAALAGVAYGLMHQQRATDALEAALRKELATVDNKAGNANVLAKGACYTAQRAEEQARGARDCAEEVRSRPSVVVVVRGDQGPPRRPT
jgi:hypothetical protein